MIYQIQQYFQFLWRSSNQHGVHSPFVYNLVTQCFYDKKRYPEYKQIKKYKSELLKNNITLNITDLGSGSKYTKQNLRQIKSIAKNSGASIKQAKLLFRLTAYFKFQQSLELGTSLGISTLAVALGNKKGTVTSIEGCPEVSKFTKETLNTNNIQNTSIICGDFKTVIPELPKSTYDFVFFDGNHNKDATLSYFNLLLPQIHNDTVFIFDDIYWSKDMTDAWETIKNHPMVRVTIDTFHYGFVFFRKEQEKEHFTIRL
ncbi:O-methyltransferase [Formosa sp. S-31]|uniref:O-methyltransferase n=1 Tax=Formosa sp. S-31 TaxID=2790949 RepID=UPI003EBD1926